MAFKLQTFNKTWLNENLTSSTQISAILSLISYTTCYNLANMRRWWSLVVRSPYFIVTLYLMNQRSVNSLFNAFGCLQLLLMYLVLSMRFGKHLKRQRERRRISEVILLRCTTKTQKWIYPKWYLVFIPCCTLYGLCITALTIVLIVC